MQSNKGTWLEVIGNKFPWFNMICLDFCQLSFYAIYLTITDRVTKFIYPVDKKY